MDMNEYTLQMLARDRLAEMRAAGERSSRIAGVRPRARPLRVALGHALIRMGHRLQGGRGSSLLTLGAGGAVDAPRTSMPEARRG
jgi:hypothetical protein